MLFIISYFTMELVGNPPQLPGFCSWRRNSREVPMFEFSLMMLRKLNLEHHAKTSKDKILISV